MITKTKIGEDEYRVYCDKCHCGAFISHEDAWRCGCPTPYQEIKAQRDELLRELKRVEWIEVGDHELRCVNCYSIKHLGHSRGCTLAAALKKAGGDQ